MPGSACITPSLYAGLQLILPGEVAPSHRHTQSALRFIVEGEGAYTAVDGERTDHARGRFRHHADLDLARPRQRFDEADGVAGRARHPDGGDVQRGLRRERRERRAGRHRARRHVRRQVRQRPAAGRLEARAPDLADLQLSLCAHARGAAGPRPRPARPMPATATSCATSTRRAAAHRSPTMGTFMQLLPKGFATAPYRSTDGTVFSVVEGEGESVIGDKTFRWKKRDHFVVPSWARVVHKRQGRSGAVLLLRPPGAGEARSVARGSRRALACERVLRCEPKASRLRLPGQHPKAPDRRGR